MLYNVRWNNSKTKMIYQATKKSELLMEYLEKRLLEEEICKLIGEQPTAKRGYGVLYYYYSSKPKRRLLSSAPRRDHDYIHIVMFNNLVSREQLHFGNFDLGNEVGTPDIKIHTKEEIDSLIKLIKQNLHRS